MSARADTQALFPAERSTNEVCDRLERGDCDDTDKCRAYGCRWHVASTTFQWLIERGQPEGETQTLWYSHYWPDNGDNWITEARRASMHPTKETAEAYIAERGFEARAVEHGFGFGGTHEMQDGGS